MNMMTAIAAVPSVAAPSVVFAATPFDRRRWDVLSTRFATAQRKYDRLVERQIACEEAWDEMHPRLDHFFDEYRLRIGMDREVARTTAMISLTCKAPPIRLTTNEEKRAACRENNRKSERIADEFMAYQQRHFETKRLCRIDETNAEVKAFVDQEYIPARDALMAVPAPDQAALLQKIEIAAVSLAYEHQESVLEDARRLLV